MSQKIAKFVFNHRIASIALLAINFFAVSYIVNESSVGVSELSIPVEKLATDHELDNVSSSNTVNVEEKETYTLIFGGDVMLGRTVGWNITVNGFNPFKKIQTVLREADLTVVNMEYVASDMGYPTPGKLYTFRSSPSTVDTIRDAGIDMVSVANNHAGDYGRYAFSDMLSQLTKRKVGYFGGGSNKREAYSPRYIFLGEITVALIGVSGIETPYFAATSSKSGIAWISDVDLKKYIGVARKNADVVIVFPHWGAEYTKTVTTEQKRLAKLMISAGADLVIGGHPHHIQRSEEFKNGEIFYSMGNLVFDGPGPNAGWYKGELIEVKISQEGEVVATRKIPYSISNAGLVNFQ